MSDNRHQRPNARPNKISVGITANPSSLLPPYAHRIPIRCSGTRLGSPGALLHRAREPQKGVSGLERCWVFAGAGCPALAVRVAQAGVVRCGFARVGGHVLFGDRFAGGPRTHPATERCDLPFPVHGTDLTQHLRPGIDRHHTPPERLLVRIGLAAVRLLQQQAVHGPLQLARRWRLISRQQAQWHPAQHRRTETINWHSSANRPSTNEVTAGA
jgi:hypothetical protein